MSKEKIEVIEFHDRDGQRIPLEANNYDETATNNEKNKIFQIKINKRWVAYQCIIISQLHIKFICL